MNAYLFSFAYFLDRNIPMTLMTVGPREVAVALSWLAAYAIAVVILGRVGRIQVKVPRLFSRISRDWGMALIAAGVFATNALGSRQGLFLPIWNVIGFVFLGAWILTQVMAHASVAERFRNLQAHLERQGITETELGEDLKAVDSKLNQSFQMLRRAKATGKAAIRKVLVISRKNQRINQDRLEKLKETRSKVLQEMQNLPIELGKTASGLMFGLPFIPMIASIYLGLLAARTWNPYPLLLKNEKPIGLVISRMGDQLIFADSYDLKRGTYYPSFGIVLLNSNQELRLTYTHSGRMIPDWGMNRGANRED